MVVLGFRTPQLECNIIFRRFYTVEKRFSSGFGIICIASLVGYTPVRVSIECNEPLILISFLRLRSENRQPNPLCHFNLH